MWLFPLLSCQPTIEGPKPDDDTGVPTLAITGVAPTSGPAAGGTSVSVRGAAFTDTTEALVGEAPCASTTWLSDEELVCVTPGGAPGLTTVRVVDGAAEASIAFEYLPGEDTGGGDTGGPPVDDTGDTSGGDTGEDSGGDTGDAGDTSDTGDTDDTGGARDTGDTGDTGETVVTVPIDYCHLQWPCSQSVATSATSEDVYGWVYQAGVTQGSGQGAGITLEVGYGPDGSDPATDGGWSWSSMRYNVDKDGLSSGDLANDEYMGSFSAPGTAGSYDYCVRASADGGASWTYCDAGGDSCGGSGSDDGYSAADAGALTVE